MRAEQQRYGLLFDVDGVLRLGTPRRQLGRLRALRSMNLRDRRSILAMPRLIRALSTDLGGAPVFYLTALPMGLARPVANLLIDDGYPSGSLLPTGARYDPRWILGGSWENKTAAIERLAERAPDLRWVLVGDDGGHDPRVFVDVARRAREQVALVAMRQVLHADRPKVNVPHHANGSLTAAVVAAPNGEELLSLARTALGVRVSRAATSADWFVSDFERRNAATRLQTWTVPNAARPLLHGRAYYAALANALARTGAGDVVHFVGWRGDADELLTDDGPTVSDALCGAAERGAEVRGLLWRGHSGVVGSNYPANRKFARVVARSGGEVLLDQRVLPFGSHHQKMVVIRYRQRPEEDVAFIGGIDLDHGSRDDADHRGDRQSVGADAFFGPSPAYHDLQLELRGPAVREADEVFRERWEDPAPLSRLPWHVVPDRIHRLQRRGSPLRPALPDPPAAGTCAVQLLRTYPRRRPRYPYAPTGERSIALAYTKALGRAERLVYIEDQYLWSFDVARIFAAALQRASQLHLIAVVPRRPDNENPFYVGPATLGHAEAMGMVREAGGDRVQILDVENNQGLPVYVHSKVCIVDDVWAAVGSNNFNTRSWTHDSELTAAVLDSERDPRAPTDPAGSGDGARRFARELRLAILREHLDRDRDDDLLDLAGAAEAVRTSAAELDAWHERGGRGPRPPGRLRNHVTGVAGELPARHRWFTAPVYRSFLDPDGRPVGMRLRRTY